MRPNLPGDFSNAGVGQYGAGDLFLGIKVPVLRAFVRDLKGAGIEVALPLLKSGWHEARAVGLLLLIQIYQRGDEKGSVALVKGSPKRIMLDACHLIGETRCLILRGCGFQRKLSSFVFVGMPRTH